jgi:uncharacterized membrane protein
MIRILVLVFLTTICSISCLAGEAENIRVVTAMVEAINDRDLDRLDTLVAADIVRHSAATEGVSFLGTATTLRCEPYIREHRRAKSVHLRQVVNGSSYHISAF